MVCVVSLLLLVNNLQRLGGGDALLAQIGYNEGVGELLADGLELVLYLLIVGGSAIETLQLLAVLGKGDGPHALEALVLLLHLGCAGEELDAEDGLCLPGGRNDGNSLALGGSYSPYK